jgi:8-oxo-dGTP diphosphatase
MTSFFTGISEVLDSGTKTVADSTSHTAVATALRARRGRLEVLLDHGALPAERLADGEPLASALGRAVDVELLAHVEQLETRVLRRGGVATAYLGLVRADTDPGGTWVPVTGLPRLSADDAELVAAAQSRLRAKLSYTNVGFALAPEVFTLSELREIYVAALGYDVSATNLQRVLLRRGVLDRIDGRRPSGRAGGRPAALFRFASQQLEITDEFAALRPPR